MGFSCSLARSHAMGFSSLLARSPKMGFSSSLARSLIVGFSISLARSPPSGFSMFGACHELLSAFYPRPLFASISECTFWKYSIRAGLAADLGFKLAQDPEQTNHQKNIPTFCRMWECSFAPPAEFTGRRRSRCTTGSGGRDISRYRLH